MAKVDKLRDELSEAIREAFKGMRSIHPPHPPASLRRIAQEEKISFQFLSFVQTGRRFPSERVLEIIKRRAKREHADRVKKLWKMFMPLEEPKTDWGDDSD